MSKFIDDEFVLFKEHTMLELKTMFYSLPTGASGGGNLPRGYDSLKKAIDMHRHYTTVKLNNAPKPRLTSAEYQLLDDGTKSLYGRFCGHNKVYYTLIQK